MKKIIGNKKIRVAVIDSGLNLNDPFFSNYKIVNYSYKEDGFYYSNTYSNNFHGAEVTKILLRESPDIEVISIQILKQNNHCSILELVEAIKFCIKIKVDIINMSLGISNLTDLNLKYLQDLCIVAKKQGIVLFASDHNDEKKLSYPANFKEVIGIRTQSNLKDFCSIDFLNNNLIFSDALFYIPDKNKYLIRKGNSYLTAHIVGLFCNYFLKVANETNQNSFLEYIRAFSEKQNVEKIYFLKNDETERNSLNGRRIIYFSNVMDKNNIHIFSMYREACDIKQCDESMFYKTESDLLNWLSQIDILFIGALNPNFILDNKKNISKIIKLVLSNQKGVITLFPILNVYERMKLVSQFGGYIKSIYK